MKIQKYIYLLFLIVGQFLSGFSQTTQNPFELTPRLPEPLEEIDTSTTVNAEESSPAGNPFDIVKNKSTVPERKKKTLPKPKQETQSNTTVSSDSEQPGLLFPALLTILILTTVLLTIFRGYVARIYQAVFSDNMLHQLYTDRMNIGLTTAFIPLYIFFFLNAGLFVYLTLDHFGQLPSGASWVTLALITGGVTGLFLLKHMVLLYVGWVFPVSEEVSNYNFTIIVFSIFIGMGLVLLNLGIAYVPDGVTKWLIYTAFIFIGLTYLLRYLRGVFIADKYIRFHKFHFLLYICTVEIAPVLFLYRFFTDQIQG